jgi:hypothetical protein
MSRQEQIHQPPKKLAFPPKKSDTFAFDFTEKELIDGLGDPRWRLENLYTIIDAKKRVVIFRPNIIQTTLLDNMWYRNAIIKARKGGISTAVQLLMLDTCLNAPNERGKVICNDLSVAEGILRDVFVFAYNNIPAPLKATHPTVGEASKSKIEFANNSLVEVTTSARGTTPTFLHISEYGKLSARDPGKAKEIQTGSITAASEDALVFVESTAEGNSGAFYDMIQTAKKLEEAGAKLWKLDLKLFFFPWWKDPKYTAPESAAIVSPKDNEYFDKIEGECGCTIDAGQRAWYVKFKDVTYSGDTSMMYQEMPSTVEEPFMVSLEGAYFTDQFTRARKEDRIGLVPYDRSYGVNLFWDLGQNDLMSIWFIQAKRTHYAVIDYLEGCGEAFAYFVDKINQKGYVIGYNYIPHDSNQRRVGAYSNKTAEEELLEVAPYFRTWGIERTPNKVLTINQTRNIFGTCVFDAQHCKQGLIRLERYKKEWNARLATWRDTPKHDENSNAADAFLLFGQAVAEGHFSVVHTNMGGPHGNNFGSAFQPDVDLSY